MIGDLFFCLKSKANQGNGCIDMKKKMFRSLSDEKIRRKKHLSDSFNFVPSDCSWKWKRLQLK